MADLSRVQCVWSGFIGSPGYTTLYFAGATPPNIAAVRAWFDGLKTALANVVTVQVQPVGDVIDDADGSLTGSWSAAPVLPVTGTGGTAYSAPSGFIVNYLTPGIKRGRRVRGRSFMVPAASAAYDTTGTILNALLTNINTANTNFLIAVTGSLAVWTRPTDDDLGGHAIVSTIVTPDKSCVLRSRRD